jgi:2-polyprenyl-3-methyl-5-hydroxy-6-metoxy-1,4-benzoquinol methylase
VAAYRIETFGELLLARMAAGSLVLEIGCGAGELATMLAHAGLEVEAIDRAPRAEFPAITASLETYDARDKRFDAVIAMLVLHHVDGAICIRPRSCWRRWIARLRASISPITRTSRKGSATIVWALPIWVRRANWSRGARCR